MPQVGAIFTAAATAFGATAVGSFLTTTFVGKLLTSVALSALSAALAPKPRPPGIKTSQTMTGGTNPCQFILGRYATGGYAAAPAMSHGKVNKTPNAYLTYVIEVSDQPVTAINGLIIDGQYAAIGAGVHADYGNEITGDYQDRAWIKFYTGSQTTADAMLLAKYASYPERPWSSDMIGRGLAYAIMTFRYDRKVFDNLPSVRFVVDGIKLYDPRLDTTVGGSGSQRWATPSTWAFTQNPVVMAYNILRGITLPDGSIWGGGAAAADLPLSNWFAAMNVCDVSVAVTAESNRAQYTAGFEVSVDDEPAAVIEELMKACNGQLVDMGGIWKVRAGGPGLPVYFFTDEEIIATRPEDFDPFPGLAETYNGITATYPAPSSLWESREAPPRYNSTWETQDGGRRLVASLGLPAVTHWAQVQQLMLSAIKDHRRMRRHNLTLMPAAMILEPLDTVSWTSARNGYSAKVFEVAQVSDDLRGCLPQVALREVDAADYSWSTADELPHNATPGRPVKPAAQSLPSAAVAPVTVLDGDGIGRRPALRLTWDATDLDDVYGVLFNFRVKGTSNWQKRYDASPEDGQLMVVGGILPDTIYEWRARPDVTSGARPFAWTAIGEVLSDPVYLDSRDLTQQDGDNLLANGRVVTGDFRGWSSVPATFTVIEKNPASGSAAIATCPTRWMVRMTATSGAAVDDTQAILGVFDVEGNEDYSVGFRYSGGSTGSGINGTVGVYVYWYDKTDTVISTTSVTQVVTSNTWGRKVAIQTAPANAVYARAQLRYADGGTGTMFATGMFAKQRREAEETTRAGSVKTAQIADNAATKATFLFNDASVAVGTSLTTLAQIVNSDDLEAAQADGFCMFSCDLTFTPPSAQTIMSIGFGWAVTGGPSTPARGGSFGSVTVFSPASDTTPITQKVCFILPTTFVDDLPCTITVQGVRSAGYTVSAYNRALTHIGCKR